MMKSHEENEQEINKELAAREWMICVYIYFEQVYIIGALIGDNTNSRASSFSFLFFL